MGLKTMLIIACLILSACTITRTYIVQIQGNNNKITVNATVPTTIDANPIVDIGVFP